MTPQDRHALAEASAGRPAPAEVSAELLTQLTHGRMIVPDDADEVAMLGARSGRARAAGVADRPGVLVGDQPDPS
ncbi:hypothetical protein AB3X52_04150 [Nocardioides sp. DS6]|uniref:Uncharacterized protein n=1 Tax=Nocardioides eburneus TaxID=3231482 RepID=A0ABV3SV33_9ACTN